MYYTHLKTAIAPICTILYIFMLQTDYVFSTWYFITVYIFVFIIQGFSLFSMSPNTLLGMATGFSPLYIGILKSESMFLPGFQCALVNYYTYRNRIINKTYVWQADIFYITWLIISSIVHYGNHVSILSIIYECIAGLAIMIIIRLSDFIDYQTEKSDSGGSPDLENIIMDDRFTQIVPFITNCKTIFGSLSLGIDIIVDTIDKQQRSIDDVKSIIQKLNGIIQLGLLTCRISYRITTCSKNEYDYFEINVEEIVSGYIQNYKDISSIAISHHIFSDVPVKINIQPELLHDVIFVLLLEAQKLNACKKIDIEIEFRDKHLYIKIKAILDENNTSQTLNVPSSFTNFQNGSVEYIESQLRDVSGACGTGPDSWWADIPCPDHVNKPESISNPSDSIVTLPELAFSQLKVLIIEPDPIYLLSLRSILTQFSIFAENTHTIIQQDKASDIDMYNIYKKYHLLFVNRSILSAQSFEYRDHGMPIFVSIDFSDEKRKISDSMECIQESTKEGMVINVKKILLHVASRFSIQYIMIVEDDPISSKLMTKMVESKGMIPFVANNGFMALNEIKSSERQYLAILTDMNLNDPEMSGSEFIKEFVTFYADKPKKPYTCIVTSYTFASHCDGADDIYFKPFKMVHLETIIVNAMKKWMLLL